ncbi:hypothetical protein GDO86_016633 [Hymenochirus boettgeri]|uniref:G patch domain-containing protein 4 n=1 Tax=Hymenochirus boettgeri TaxID=247094 RepID=A0A8T2JXT7_9PIPI|nr:hypothetical protein GDO86_016633 [Hymenochirus boettgeri]
MQQIYALRMDSSPGKKSKGMKFAEKQLHKHGWTEGKGLGRKENGISEAIKVKVKCGTAGVGHNSAEQFTFHWWDHVFNKTASSISIEADKDGVQVKRLKEESGTITNKKPRKALSNPNMLYGRFIKSATLLSGGEQSMKEPSSSDSSDSDEDEKLDLSSATKLTDEDLIKVCGGRTAHKGARHGLTMSAKLSRLEEQEREFLDKYGKKQETNKYKEQTLGALEEAGARKKKSRDSPKNTESSDSHEARRHKKKKRKKEKLDEKEEGMLGNEEVLDFNTEQEDNSAKKKKKKSKKKEQDLSPPREEQTELTIQSLDSFSKSKKKRKHKSE